MAQSVQNYSVSAGVASPSTTSITLSAGTSRKIVVIVGFESTGNSVSSCTFDGNACTASVSIDYSSGNPNLRAFYYDVSDATGAGSYDVVVTMASAAAHTVMVWQTAESATGAPEATDSAEQYTSATVTGAGMTVTAGSLTIVGAINGAASATWDSYSSGITERLENNEANFTTTAADGVQAGAGSYTASATASTGNQNKAIIALSIAASGGSTPVYPQNRGRLIGTGTIGQGNGFGYKRF